MALVGPENLFVRMVDTIGRVVATGVEMSQNYR